MFTLYYDEELALQYAREEAFEEGIEKGIEKGKLEAKLEDALSLRDVLDIPTIAQKLKLTDAEVAVLESAG